MKKVIFFFSLICLADGAFCQNQQTYDSSFRQFYKGLALHPGHRNLRGIVEDSVIKRWDKDIDIYVEGGSSKDRREVVAKLKNTIAVISPAFGNKIKISFSDKKASANYLIKLDSKLRTGWHLKWDGLDNIYSCELEINPEKIFNRDEQAGLVSHYFLESLGDFVIMPHTPPVASNIRLWRQDINDVDLQILKLHYSDAIKPGMAGKDIDQFFGQNN